MARIKKTALMGRPRISELKREEVLRMYDEDKYTVKQIAEIASISVGSLYNIVNERERKNGIQEQS